MPSEKPRSPHSLPGARATGALARALGALPRAPQGRGAEGDDPGPGEVRLPPERVLEALLPPLGSVEIAHRLAELDAQTAVRAAGEAQGGGESGARADGEGEARADGEGGARADGEGEARADGAAAEAAAAGGAADPSATRPGAMGGARERARALRDRAATRLEELRAAALEPLARPFEGRGRLPGPDAFHARLEEICAGADGATDTDGRGQSDGPAPREIAEAARDLARPYHDRTGAAVRRARGLVAGVRLRLGDEIRALGDDAAEIADLDALLADHTAARTAELFDRIPEILAEHFEADLLAAARAAPVPVPRAYTDGFFAEGGWVTAHIQRCREAIAAVFEHERRAVWGLVAAACEAVGEPASAAEPAAPLASPAGERTAAGAVAGAGGGRPALSE